MTGSRPHFPLSLSGDAGVIRRILEDSGRSCLGELAEESSFVESSSCWSVGLSSFGASFEERTCFSK